MKIELSKQFTDALSVLLELEKNNFEAFFVGGSVRDSLLNREIHDVDITTSATPNEVKKIFKTADDYSGEKHGTELVFSENGNYEVTTFRIDGEYSDSRRPDQVFFTRNLKDDLARRDFTINALALSTEGEIFDFFNGIKDLEDKNIKTVGNAFDRFKEDALRILRAYRFSSQLNFDIDNDALVQSKKLAKNLKIIATERIQEEFGKLLSGSNVENALRVMFENEIHLYLPGNVYIQNKNVFLNFKGGLDKITAWTNFIYLAEIDNVTEYLNKWKFSNKESEIIINSILLLKNNNLNNFDLFKSGETAVKIASIISENKLDIQFENLIIKDRSELQINGNDLIKIGIKKGPKIGKILNEILSDVLENKVVNEKETLIKEAININKS